MRTLTQEITARIRRDEWPQYGDITRSGRVLRQAQLGLASPLMREVLSNKERRALVTALRRAGYQIPTWALIESE